MQNTVPLALLPPDVITHPDASHSSSTRLFQGIPTLERTQGGRLWAAWYGGGPDQPWEGPGNYVILATSADDGLSWQSPILVINPHPTCRAFDSCLWLDPVNRLWLFWAQSSGGYDGRGGVWAIVTENAEEPKPLWSAPRRLSDGVMMNKPTVRDDGTWLLPVAYWQEGRTAGNNNAGSENPNGPRGSHLLVSTDNGESFVLQPGPSVPQVSFDEHMVLEGPNGALTLLVRTEYGIASTTSQDDGKSWTEAVRTALSPVSSRFFVRKLHSGHLLLVSNQPPEGSDRSHLTAQLSLDGGQSWVGGLVLDERSGVSYPDGYQAPDGTIGILYDRNRQTDREILLAQFTEEDVLAGSWVTPTSRSRLLIDRATGQAGERA